ncbi:MAG TPA: PQQ-dependent sugar dehydrogenase [Pseudonocardiaceae bacterium]|nr:PQQ-dependent sugar dehydrogenase [Pseudonocardiaceae bacterium]
MTIPPSKPDPLPSPGDNLDRWARINYLGEIPDGSGRLSVPDLNGKMYLIKDGKPQIYLDVGVEFAPNFLNTKSLSSGFIFATFAPDFNKTGKFYTAHTEAGPALNPKVPQVKMPDLPYPQNMPAQAVVTEWKATDPSASAFKGTRREALRLGFADTIHGLQQIDFNPTAQPGDKDYGLLYIAAGDGGVVGEESPGVVTTVPQDLRVPQGKILRIDPRGTNGANGNYGIPADNPFVGKPGAALGEIYASGLRDPVRFSWDSGNGHRMFLATLASSRSNRSTKYALETISGGASRRARLYSRPATPLVVSLPRLLMTANTATFILWWLSPMTHRRVSHRVGPAGTRWSAVSSTRVVM